MRTIATFVAVDLKGQIVTNYGTRAVQGFMHRFGANVTKCNRGRKRLDCCIFTTLYKSTVEGALFPPGYSGPRIPNARANVLKNENDSHSFLK